VAKNHYADGPFCQFSLTSAPSVSGVYAVFIEDELRYIGECEDLYRRFGSTGYGRISPRNCHDDGQSTNCKLNSRVLAEAKNCKRTIVWFYTTEDRKAIEARLIFALNPPWNGRMESGLNSYRNDKNHAPYKHYSKSVDSSGIPTTEDFRIALIKILNNAERDGKNSITVRAGDLHRSIGGYPGDNHRMVCCCNAMRSIMKELGDRIVAEPPSGNGANLIIEYQLPRAK
jgi:hypothetical protein